MAPVRFAIARCARSGSRPASQAITASTANSGSVCNQARMASAAPWEIRNCAASAPHATRNADARMLGKVHSADRAEPPATDRKASTFSFTCAEDSPAPERSEEHTSELQSLAYLVCRLLLEKKKKKQK